MGKRVGAGLGKDKGQSSSSCPAEDDDPNKPPGKQLKVINNVIQCLMLDIAL